MHITCMATKTISLKLEAYERLRRARRAPTESFSDVVMRARWPEMGMSGDELLRAYEAEGPLLSPTALDRIEEASRSDEPPEDKWGGR